jgi:hypothetical protein
MAYHNRRRRGRERERASKKQFVKSAVFCDMKVCSSVKSTYVSEKLIDSIFMAEV